MKTITTTISAPILGSHLPDFGGRARRTTLGEQAAHKNHGKLKIRPIQLDDEEEMIRFHENISEESIYRRYFEYLGLDRRTAHERLARVCANGANSYALVAERPETKHHPAAILAVGRLTTTPTPYVASFDTLLVDEVSISKLGKVLLRRLIRLARTFGFQQLSAELLVADHETLNVCRSLGFSLHTLPEDGLVRVTLDL